MKQLQNKIIKMDTGKTRQRHPRIHLGFAFFIRDIEHFIKWDPKGTRTRKYLEYLSKPGVLEGLPEGYFKSRDFSMFFSRG
jgi:hypothetical protein